VRAYVAARVLKGGNGGLDTATRHAVSEWVAWAMGARPADTECGSIGALKVGEWADGDPRNCSRCTAAIERHAFLARRYEEAGSVLSQV
jgi:hypothetical protein